MAEHSSPVNLEQVDRIARGDGSKRQRYLQQFVDLMRGHVDSLRVAAQQDDVEAIRKTLHTMTPQLQFFEVKGSLETADQLRDEMSSQLPGDCPSHSRLITIVEGAISHIQASMNAS